VQVAARTEDEEEGEGMVGGSARRRDTAADERPDVSRNIFIRFDEKWVYPLLVAASSTSPATAAVSAAAMPAAAPVSTAASPPAPLGVVGVSEALTAAVDLEADAEMEMATVHNEGSSNSDMNRRLLDDQVEL
jgi:hypothetical protein